MRGSIPPEDLQELLAGYVLGDISPTEARQIEQLIASDPAIASEITQLQQVLESTHNTPEINPPPALKEAILAAYQPAREEYTHKLLAWRRNWPKGLGVVAAMLILGLSISNYLLWRALQTSRAEIAQIQPLTLVLQPIAVNTPASVKVKVNPQKLEATLTVKDLPPLSPGKVYVLWTVLAPNAPFTTDTKNAILTQVFTVDADGNLSRQIPVPPVFRQQGIVKAVAVTVEDATAPQRHKSSPILIQQL
ncbi:anti-sigma factor domain-containing protein [Calothrix sp. PCC 7507]|uniref:anti-sigma factor n=1 Tax=Calothrix sp. PCC 7507 TaxID=99598 RepID=UPI00029ED469|nr:anti-sigma factor [Calothrix sp. PCC 7507]AFY30613.1 Anti-sigma-K factor RskA [Calothrix sp. PCC 7507]